MSVDIKLDEQTHDISIINNDISLTQTKEESLAQRLKVKLLFFLGEWVVNTGFGIPYYQVFFVKGVTKQQIDSIYRQNIVETPDVTRITYFNSTLDPYSREYGLDFTVLSTDGVEVTINLTG